MFRCRPYLWCYSVDGAGPAGTEAAEDGLRLHQAEHPGRRSALQGDPADCRRRIQVTEVLYCSCLSLILLPVQWNWLRTRGPASGMP